MLKSKRVFALCLSMVIGVGLLTACGGGNRSTKTSATSAPQAAPAATLPPIPTAIPDTATPTATTRSTAAPTNEPVAVLTSAPAVAPSQSNQSGAALEQLLEQLNNANSAGDSLSDVPQIK